MMILATLKQNFLQSLTSSRFSLSELIIAIGLSLIASVAIYIVYRLFYGSEHIGAGVDRTFIIAGPAITALFLGIQSSIPLSLGLLGALSFVRFRTPVKDPAEIGYLLLLIATSIGAATHTYLITIVLFIMVFLALCIQWIIRRKFAFPSQANFIISVNKSVFSDIEPALTQLLQNRLSGLTMKTMSVHDNRVSIHYQHKKVTDIDKADLIVELNKLAGPADIEFFAG